MTQASQEHQPRPQRRYPRVPIEAPVELHLRERSGPPIVGRVENLSAGGLLASCRESLDTRAELAMLFSLPSGQAIHALGRVIYAKPNGRYGVEFIDLDRDSFHQVEQFTRQVLGYIRRSSRVPHRTPLVIRAAPDSPDLEAVETVLVSRNGGLLVCRGAYREGQEIYLWSPSRQRGARARVVFQQVWASDAVVELGFEFLEPARFWEVSFPDEDS